MKRIYSTSSLITVISLLLGVIWLSPAFAAAPAFTSLGQFKAEGLRVPGAMDLDGAGNLYVADARGGKVHKFSPSGDLLHSFDLQASGRGLAVTPDGAYLYVSLKNSVVIVDKAGAVVGSLVGGPEFGVAGEIDLDAAGNVFVADTENMLVKIYNSAGQYRSRIGAAGTSAGQFVRIGGMAINPAGQVVVTDTSVLNGKIHVFTLGSALEVTGVAAYGKGVAANFGAPAMYVPRAVAFDAQGRGYFLEYLSSEVRVANASFGYLGKYSKAGYAVSQLNNVTDAVFDNVNNRLLVGCDTGRIEVFGIDGGQSPVYVNHAPSSPVPQSPVAGSEVDSVNPALVINNATDEDGDALTYKIIISQADEVVSQMDVLAEAGDTTTVLVAANLAENTAYSWTVQASDGRASSAVSPAANFIVNALEESPSVPTLSSPVNGEAVDGLDVLSWSESTDPDPNDNISYQVEVALDEAFTQVVATEALTGLALSLDSFAHYDSLVEGSGYFWRVTALDDAQTTSAPSDAGMFVYDTTILYISANMPDAVVSFFGNHAYAGQSIGVAPIELRDFTSGPLSVVVERSGFEPFVTQVNLAEGENVDLYAELLPAMAVGNRSISKNGINGRSGLSVRGAAAPLLVDFDNDGDLDLLVGDGSGQVTLFPNMQLAGPNKLSFDQGVSLGLPVLSGAVPFVADWNNDGRKDLIVGLVDGSVKLFVNEGLEVAPAFGAGTDLQVAGSAFSVGENAAPAVTDYDGDGDKDLLVGNASGQVLVFLNQGSDAAPLLSAPLTALQVDGAVVPFPVDWNADGQKELMLTANGAVTVYSKVGGEYRIIDQFSDKKAEFVSAFPIAFGDSGKQLLVGQSNGEIVYLTGNSNGYAASFAPALQDKLDELSGFVAEEAPELLADVAALDALVSAGDYAAAALAADALSVRLAAGAAQTSAFELADLCR